MAQKTTIMQATHLPFLYWNPTVSTESRRISEYSQDFGAISVISETFNTEQLPPPDVALLSSDGVFFCIHLSTARRRSHEAFQSALSASLILNGGHFLNTVELNCPSMELNIILHALYELQTGPYQPEPATVEAAVDFMPHLDIIVDHVILPECPMYQYIESYTPLRPLHVYALAAHHGVHSLAVHASGYLLDIEPHTVSDELAERMGMRYFMKLIRLRATRAQALKDALLAGPLTHQASEADTCGFSQQQQAKQVWAHLCADPRWHSDPLDYTVNDMDRMLESLLEDLTCPECKSLLRRMVARVKSLWVSVPVCSP